MKRLFLPLAVLLVAGCHSGGAKPAASNAKKKDELAAKLKTMTPEARAKYFREHPTEVQSAFTFGGS